MELRIPQRVDPPDEEWDQLIAPATTCAVSLCSIPLEFWMVSEMVVGVPVIYPVCGKHSAMIELVDLDD